MTVSKTLLDQPLRTYEALLHTKPLTEASHKNPNSEINAFNQFFGENFLKWEDLTNGNFHEATYFYLDLLMDFIQVKGRTDDYPLFEKVRDLVEHPDKIKSGIDYNTLNMTTKARKQQIKDLVLSLIADHVTQPYVLANETSLNELVPLLDQVDKITGLDVLKHLSMRDIEDDLPDGIVDVDDYADKIQIVKQLAVTLAVGLIIYQASTHEVTFNGADTAVLDDIDAILADDTQDYVVSYLIRK